MRLKNTIARVKTRSRQPKKMKLRKPSRFRRFKWAAATVLLSAVFALTPGAVFANGVSQDIYRKLPFFVPLGIERQIADSFSIEAKAFFTHASRGYEMDMGFFNARFSPTRMLSFDLSGRYDRFLCYCYWLEGRVIAKVGEVGLSAGAAHNPRTDFFILGVTAPILSGNGLALDIIAEAYSSFPYYGSGAGAGAGLSLRSDNFSFRMGGRVMDINGETYGEVTSGVTFHF